MISMLDSLANSKLFLVISGFASIISLVLTIALKDNFTLWVILTLQMVILILLYCLIKYNSKIIGRLDNINMYIIGQTIELESSEEEANYCTDNNSIIILHSNLSPDTHNQQCKATLEVRLPAYLKMKVDDIQDNIRIEEKKADWYKISIELIKEITYIKLKSFIVNSDDIDKFLTSSMKIDIKLSSPLLNETKDQYIDIEVS